ncbi:MAG TPA: diacylglycerol kinase family protein, partial [Candidatus Saccharimonadales bacterium]
ESNPELAIIAGGDGTVSSVLGYLAGSTVTVGIIPLGTTNNFARSLNLPLSIPEAVQAILASQAHPVDLGLINKRPFANVVGIGLSAAIAAGITNRHKKLLGRLAYALTGAVQLFRHRPFVVTMSDPDGELKASYETHQVIIANGSYHAGRQIAQDAQVDNRELVLFPLGGPSRRSLILHTLDFYLGRRKKIVHSPYLTGKHITVTLSRAQPLEIDGEPHPASTTLRASVAPKIIKIRYAP